ncbi:FAD-dependent oxidoreductase [Streptomyces sp. NPDC051907]|uniref:NAD(P)/FAD-dependent oxidoreductase n=1 Tax=Streptomyces sp. NPDC051907 TaxID=3155284 RepID=UPI0034278973
MKTIAVVGASLAGLSAARSLRKQGYDQRLVVIGEEAHRPYDRPPLSKEFLAGDIDEPALSLEMEDEDLDAEWLLGARAIGLDLRQRGVVLGDGRRVHADGVVIATGAAARRLPGTADLTGVHVLRTLDDALALRRDLALGGRLVVIGGGFIGAEVASTAHTLGLDVTIVEAGEAPLAGVFGKAMAASLAGLHAANGVKLLTGTGVRSLTGRGRVRGVLLHDGTVVPADTVVVGIGAVPCVDWLRDSGVRLSNGVHCGPSGLTDVPGVVAVGDCANWYDPTTGSHRRVEHWTGARELAAAAAAALLDPATPDPEPKPPYFWSDQYGTRIQFAGNGSLADSVAVEEGAVDDGSFVAVYRRQDTPVAVLGVNATRTFTRWRRQLMSGVPSRAAAR